MPDTQTQKRDTPNDVLKRLHEIRCRRERALLDIIGSLASEAEVMRSMLPPAQTQGGHTDGAVRV